MRRADTVHQFDLADDSNACLPVEDRQLPPLTARNCLRDFGLCRGSAAVLFSLFALIALVTTNSNTDLRCVASRLCHPLKNAHDSPRVRLQSDPPRCARFWSYSSFATSRPPARHPQHVARLRSRLSECLGTCYPDSSHVERDYCYPRPNSDPHSRHTHF